MTKFTPHDALAAFRMFFEEEQYAYESDEESVTTTVTFGFLGIHHVTVMAYQKAVGVGVQISPFVPSDLLEAITCFSEQTDGRICRGASGALGWGGLYEPMVFSSREGIEMAFMQASFEVSIVEGYLEQYRLHATIPSKGIIFFADRDYQFGEA